MINEEREINYRYIILGSLINHKSIDMRLLRKLSSKFSDYSCCVRVLPGMSRPCDADAIDLGAVSVAPRQLF